MRKVIFLAISILLCISLISCDYSSSNSTNTGVSNNETSSKTSEFENETQNNESVTDKPTVVLSDKEIMISQFQSLGLSKEEAENAQEIFENVGITKIANLNEVLGSGIDGEQNYLCDFYDFSAKYDGIKIEFKIVKRKVQIIAICWSRGVNYPDVDKYNDMILNEGVKESEYGSYIYLYYKKLKNYAVDEASIGYRAIYNYETHSVSKYK